MSFLKDVLSFEQFNLKDMWKKVRKDPERLLLGAADPWSTKLWNKTGVGKDWEPITDQWGGAYGGATTTLGDTGEGVYGRAKEAGVPTEAGAGMHDIAHMISAMYAGNYGMGKLPQGMQNVGGFGGGGGDTGGMGGFPSMPTQQQQYVDPMQEQQRMMMLQALLEQQRRARMKPLARGPYG